MDESMSDVEEQALNPELSTVFSTESTRINSELEPIPEQDWKKVKEALSNLSAVIPETVVVGGVALRLHLERRGKTVPFMPAMDIDCSVARTVYDQIRSAMPVDGDSEFQVKDGVTLPKEKA